MDGNRLRDVRVKAGHTQESLAELLGIGTRQIWRYENNESDPSGDMIAKIAKALNVSSDYLLDLSGDPTPFDIEDLSALERAMVAAVRRGDKIEAIRAIIDKA